MADENLRRALMVSQGSFMPVFTRPVALILFLVIVWTVLSQFPLFRNYKDKLVAKLFPRRAGKTGLQPKSGSKPSGEK
jgi:putative tricarboxylic transport membrane protein